MQLQDPDYDPDRAEKLIIASMSRYLSTRKISSKFIHAFLSNLANRQTDRQTDKRGKTHLPPPLSEVITRQHYKLDIDLYLQPQTNSKSYMIYRMVPFPMTLSHL